MKPRGVGALLLAALAGACATGRGAPESPLAPRTTLEDAFELPPLHGAPPRVRSLSADGRVALVDWKPLHVAADGKRSWGEDLGPHLLDTDAEAREPGAETSLRSLLERTEREAHATPGRPRVVGSLADWKPARPGSLAWSFAGHRLAVEWEDALLLVDALASPGERVRVLYVDPPGKDGLGEVAGLEFSDDDRELCVRTRDELYTFPLDGAKSWPLAFEDARCLTGTLEPPLRSVTLSRDRSRALAREKHALKVTRSKPDGSAEELDAHVIALGGGSPTRLEGYDELASREREELSPDGRFVTATETDRSQQKAPTIVPDYLRERVGTIESRRELADDPWPARKLWVWSAIDGSRRAVQLPGESDCPFNVLGWAPKGPPRLAFRRTACDFRTVETWIQDESGPDLVLVERDERWIGGPGGNARWSRDGTRLLLATECLESSTTPGRSQLFAVNASTGRVEQLTEVEGEVGAFEERDDGVIVFSASRTDPARREIGCVAGGAVRWLDVPAGMNTGIDLASRGERVVFSHAELGVPAELWVVALDGGSPARPLTRTVPSEWSSREWILPQRLVTRHADGSSVRSHVYVPRESSLEAPDRPRPCVVFHHGAGYLQNVTDSMTEYEVNLVFHSRLAEQGYVVLDVDYRGSAGYGGRFRTDVQFQLGKLELEDVASGVDELARRGVIDPARVACYGGSYGGFLTLMALFTEPDRWVAGAALRSVTDWRTYHPGYTQPRLGRPSEHREAYERSSPIDLAQNLKDPLLILHGMVDTNVFAQDSIRLMEKLIDLGLDFDVMLYPSQGHTFADAAHWLDEYRRIERHLTRHLGTP